MSRAAPPPAPVPQGLVAYRQRLRRRGPLVALVPPLVAAALAAAVWRFWPCSGSECTVRAVIGWSLASLAVPTALIAGVPFNGGGARYALVVGSSIGLWLVIGLLAGRRATRVPAANWGDFRREYLWLAVPLWLGVIAGLGGFAIFVTRS
jgi:hypothetical protein